ncbi:unspecified product [Leishmania tarentolae]|uniref:Unspecified product n=1 Tax=Leishmania tarentolae TaxID=5689 RepID=A0A640KWY6_LEITA|nr:unspecified product [Leishmania tarentolae]GET93868.1 unspecified product [Leishmania tarentolae]
MQAGRVQGPARGQMRWRPLCGVVGGAPGARRLSSRRDSASCRSGPSGTVCPLPACHAWPSAAPSRGIP